MPDPVQQPTPGPSEADWERYFLGKWRPITEVPPDRTSALVEDAFGDVLVAMLDDGVWRVEWDREEGLDFGRDRQDLRPDQQLTTEQATDAERRRRLRRYVAQDQGTVNADTETLDDDFRRR